MALPFCIFILSMLSLQSFAQELQSKMTVLQLEDDQVVDLDLGEISDYFKIEDTELFKQLRTEELEVYANVEVMAIKQGDNQHAIPLAPFRPTVLQAKVIDEVSQVDLKNGSIVLAISSSGNMQRAGEELFYRSIEFWDIDNRVLILNVITDLSTTPTYNPENTISRLVEVEDGLIHIKQPNTEIQGLHFLSEQEFKYELKGNQLVNKI